MGAQFLCLLEEIISNPTRPIHELALLPEAEQKLILVEWNATTHPRQGSGTTLPMLLATQVTKQPEAVAMACEGHALTYSALNQRANQLAHYLNTLGVCPEVRVAIYCERSFELLVALWGVVKAGGAYVPIDPTYPTERVEFILEDAQVAVVIVQQQRLAPLPDHNAKVVCLDTDWPVIEQGLMSPPELHVAPDNLAYLIYTSGSTGKPKGVQVSHRCLLNFLGAMAHEPGISASDRLLAVTSLSFDIAGLELWGPAVNGGMVVLASREMATDGAQLIDALTTEAITVMQATPATWQLLIAQGWSGTAGLRILCGGEQLSQDLATQLVALGEHIWNLYGPTETTVWSTSCELAHGDARVSIGRPITNTQVYLADRLGHLVPIGVAGELSIGGEGVARGYWQRPDITAERFVPNPYSMIPGVRRYKTGDFVRARANGKLEWLARKDHQIKLRGYRIELGEIEAMLCHQAGIQEAVVVIQTERNDPQLVAYVRMVTEHPFDPVEIRKILQEQLPAYMLPSLFVSMDGFPLTPNGKIDRGALPAPEAGPSALARDFVAPSTPAERQIAQVWEEVLGVKDIGIYDNFFALGGHSLLATQVMARIKTRLQIALPLRTLFLQPTVASLAEALQQAQQPSDTAEEVLAALINDMDALSDEEAKALLEMETRENSEIENPP